MKFWYLVHGSGSPKLKVYWRPTVAVVTTERTQLWEAWWKELSWVFVQIPLHFNTSFQVGKNSKNPHKRISGLKIPRLKLWPTKYFFPNLSKDLNYHYYSE